MAVRMIILGIQFLGLIVICYIFFDYATRDEVAGTMGKLSPAKAVGVIIFLVASMIFFGVWYMRLGITHS
jgi:hypothetical protein